MQRHGQDAVVEAVVVEDIGEARGDDAAKTVIANRPGRMFARGATAEVIAGQQDARALIARLVEHKIRVGRAVIAAR